MLYLKRKNLQRSIKILIFADNNLLSMRHVNLLGVRELMLFSVFICMKDRVENRYRGVLKNTSS